MFVLHRHGIEPGVTVHSPNAVMITITFKSGDGVAQTFHVNRTAFCRYAKTLERKIFADSTKRAFEFKTPKVDAKTIAEMMHLIMSCYIVLTPANAAQLKKADATYFDTASNLSLACDCVLGAGDSVFCADLSSYQWSDMLTVIASIDAEISKSDANGRAAIELETGRLMKRLEEVAEATRINTEIGGAKVANGQLSDKVAAARKVADQEASDQRAVEEKLEADIETCSGYIETLEKTLANVSGQYANHEKRFVPEIESLQTKNADLTSQTKLLTAKNTELQASFDAAKAGLATDAQAAEFTGRLAQLTAQVTAEMGKEATLLAGHTTAARQLAEAGESVAACEREREALDGRLHKAEEEVQRRRAVAQRMADEHSDRGRSDKAAEELPRMRERANELRTTLANLQMEGVAREVAARTGQVRTNRYVATAPLGVTPVDNQSRPVLDSLLFRMTGLGGSTAARLKGLFMDANIRQIAGTPKLFVLEFGRLGGPQLSSTEYTLTRDSELDEFHLGGAGHRMHDGHVYSANLMFECTAPGTTTDWASHRLVTKGAGAVGVEAVDERQHRVVNDGAFVHMPDGETIVAALVFEEVVKSAETQQQRYERQLQLLQAQRRKELEEEQRRQRQQEEDDEDEDEDEDEEEEEDE